MTHVAQSSSTTAAGCWIFLSAFSRTRSSSRITPRYMFFCQQSVGREGEKGGGRRKEWEVGKGWGMLINLGVKAA